MPWPRLFCAPHPPSAPDSAPLPAPPSDPEGLAALVCDQLGPPLYVLDLEGRLLLANRAARRFHGLHPDAPLAELALVLVPPDAAGCVARPGGEADHRVLKSPLTAATGEPIGQLVILHEVHHERRLVRELERELAAAATREAEVFAWQREADRAKNAFLANMSHELRTPLNHVVAFASSLSDGIFGSLSAAQHDAVEKISRGAERLRVLVNDVLDFARLEARRLELAPTDVDLPELVACALEFAAAPAAARSLELAAELPAGLPSVPGDFGRLQQILTNLLMNALKFTPAGGRVWVTAELVGERLRLGVHDTGIGIAPQHQERLFDRFYQVDDSYTREHGGAGLGLAIASQLAELHGGTLKVESEVGQGSHFFLELPLHPEASSTSPRLPEATRS